MGDLNGRFDGQIGWKINAEGDKCNEGLSIVYST
jgi:hypothetical protein